VSVLTVEPILSRLERLWTELDLIDLPVQLVRGERPDLRLETPSGSVGLVLTEVTDAATREWAYAVNEVIRVQTAELNRPGFAAGPRNWLCAYTHSPGPALKVSYASRLLELPTLIHGKHRFDLVILLAGQQAVLLERGTVRVHDL
jgi:hypothetical protein